jgi:hypothetical protein
VHRSDFRHDHGGSCRNSRGGMPRSVNRPRGRPSSRSLILPPCLPLQEHNMGGVPLRFMQIWILPRQTGLEPAYGGEPPAAAPQPSATPPRAGAPPSAALAVRCRRRRGRVACIVSCVQRSVVWGWATLGFLTLRASVYKTESHPCHRLRWHHTNSQGGAEEPAAAFGRRQESRRVHLRRGRRAPRAHRAGAFRPHATQRCSANSLPPPSDAAPRTPHSRSLIPAPPSDIRTATCTCASSTLADRSRF